MRRRFIYACGVILALAPVAFAQAVASPQNDERELWLVRSQTITTDLLKDAADLTSLQRAVIWVKLAQRWWHEDQPRARDWITSATDVVAQAPNKETPEERGERLHTAQLLLTMVTPLDQELANRIVALFTTESKLTADERSFNAEALIDAAISVVKDDPERAAELGAMAMRTGTPNSIGPLLIALRRQNQKLADSLFVQALTLAKQDPGGRLANSLMFVAFPVERGVGGNVPLPPDQLRIELLQIFLPLFNDNPAGGEKQNSSCGAVRWLSPLFPAYERLLPKQMPIVWQAISRCQSVSPSAQQELDGSGRSQPLNTIEGLLKAAADAKDTGLRATYRYRAAEMAKRAGDYERALQILDDMAKEQRELMRESWTWYRVDWAADGALEHYQHGRFREMNLLLNGAPSDLQPLAKAAFVYRLPEVAAADRAPIVQILNDAIVGLRRSNMPALEKYPWYLSLLQPTVRYQFADANPILKDAIASLNASKDRKELNAYNLFGDVGPALVEMDEFVLKDALASITIVETRAVLRLSLLAATLKRVKNTSRK